MAGKRCKLARVGRVKPCTKLDTDSLPESFSGKQVDMIVDKR